jgi:hypothetical protein
MGAASQNTHAVQMVLLMATYCCCGHASYIHCQTPEAVVGPQSLPLLQAGGGPQVAPKAHTVLQHTGPDTGQPLLSA